MIHYIHFHEPVHLVGHGQLKRYSHDQDASTISVEDKGSFLVLRSKKPVGIGKRTRVPVTNCAYIAEEEPVAPKAEAKAERKEPTP